jgi:hypothetical protein
VAASGAEAARAMSSKRDVDRWLWLALLCLVFAELLDSCSSIVQTSASLAPGGEGILDLKKRYFPESPLRLIRTPSFKRSRTLKHAEF